jgi:DNA-binding LacI/PurR family transcriptional regulator
MTTRKDVARHAGVSEATVSHVINNTKYVSPDLEKKVRDAVFALSYRPNIVARSLVTKTTNHVAILVSDIKNAYYAEIMEGMQEVAAKEGYLVSLIRYGHGDSDEDLNDLAYRYIDGIFIATSRGNSDAVVRKFKEFGIAVITDVIVDYSGAVETMMKYLTQLGHKRIAFISGLSLVIADPRYRAYVKALEKLGLPYDANLVADGKPPYWTTIDSGYEAMKGLLATQSDITAVFALNDLMAIGAMRAIRDAGLRVPQDISVIGCDDIFLADSVDPPLSTLRVPKVEMGRKAMYQLLHQIRENKHETAMVNAEFIIRESAGIAKTES